MSRAFPSLTALLGLLAVAGYQNREKLSELLKRATAGGGGVATTASSGGSDKLGGLLVGAGAGGIGGLLANGLKELINRFDGAGHRDVAESWVGTGKNRECSPESLRRALGPEMITDLQSQTGLSESEIISRLCKDLPDAVDKYTPDGRLPATI